ncbi:MAG: pentapeptide repeat-containing protein [Humidesulfovibrio sp.]
MEHHWPDPQLEIYTDEAGQDYCLFHAPAEHKGMSVEDFNAQVFARIDDFKAKTKPSDAEGSCAFTSAIFPGDISFRAYGKDNPLPGISFSKATFSGRVVFNDAYFSGLTRFSEATFSGQAHFLWAIFDGLANFWSATFSDTANFKATTFNHNAIFMQTKFCGNALFRQAKLNGTAHFEQAMFDGMAYFDTTEFYGVAYFLTTSFRSGVYFWQAKFDGEAHFDRATFGGVAYFGEGKAEKNALRLHSLKNPSLANLNFTSMDTECFSFKGCDWPDRLWPETQEEPDYKACEELYRSLKQKAASEHDQPMVSKWHYREKLMALEQIKEKRGWKARLGLTGLYYWCSGFGEDPAQAFRVLAGLLVFALLALSGFKLWETGFGNYQPDWAKIWEIPAEWLALIPFVKTEAATAASAPAVLVPLKRTVTGLLHILLAAQIALFAFALRNRFRR